MASTYSPPSDWSETEISLTETSPPKDWSETVVTLESGGSGATVTDSISVTSTVSPNSLEKASVIESPTISANNVSFQTTESGIATDQPSIQAITDTKTVTPFTTALEQATPNGVVNTAPTETGLTTEAADIQAFINQVYAELTVAGESPTVAANSTTSLFEEAIATDQSTVAALVAQTARETTEATEAAQVNSTVSVNELALVSNITESLAINTPIEVNISKSGSVTVGLNLQRLLIWDTEISRSTKFR